MKRKIKTNIEFFGSYIPRVNHALFCFRYLSELMKKKFTRIAIDKFIIYEFIDRKIYCSSSIRISFSVHLIRLGDLNIKTAKIQKTCGMHIQIEKILCSFHHDPIHHHHPY